MNLNDIITTIYIIIQSVLFTIFIIINLINLKFSHRKSNYTNIYFNSYAIEILESINNRLYKFMKKLSILFIILTIAGLLLQPTIYNIIYIFIYQNKEIFALILGALLASLFGFYSNKLTHKKEDTANIARASRILYEDLNRIHNLFVFHIIKPTEKYITYNKNWINSYVHVAKLLTSKHYTCISKIYEITENINILLTENNYDNINKLIDIYNLEIKHDKVTPSFNINTEDVLIDLERLSFNKRPKWVILKNLLREAKLLNSLRKYSSEIEDLLTNEILKYKESIESTIVNKVIISLLQKHNKLRKQTQEHLNRLLFAVAINSKKIKLTWGYYTIENSKEI